MEAFLLENVPAPLLALLVTGLTVGASIAGLLAVRRRFEASSLEEHQEVAGYILAVVSVVYAVLLAFVVIAVWEDFEDAKADASSEAAAVWLLFQDARMLGEEGDAARAATVAYATSVVDDEWPEMSRHQREAAGTDRALEALWDTFSAAVASDAAGDVFDDQTIDRLHEASELRRTRIFNSRGGLPGALWAILLLGGAVCITFTYFFGAKNLTVQVLMVGALASTIGLVLFLILALELPFTGGMRVGPGAMSRVLEEFGHATP